MSVLGYEGTLTIAGSVAKHIKDVQLELSADETDDTTRNNNGWKSRRNGLKQWGANFTIQRETGDTVWTTLRNAFKNNTNLAVSIVDKTGDGASGTVQVSNFSKSEELTNPVTAEVTLLGLGEPTFLP